MVVACAFLLAACGGGGGNDEETSASQGGCEDATAKTHDDRKLSDEHLKLDASKKYRLVFATNCGDFTVTLDQNASPNATASLVSPAQRGLLHAPFFPRILPRL